MTEVYIPGVGTLYIKEECDGLKEAVESFISKRLGAADESVARHIITDLTRPQTETSKIPNGDGTIRIEAWSVPSELDQFVRNYIHQHEEEGA